VDRLAHGQILFLFLGGAAGCGLALYLRVPAGRATQKLKESVGCRRSYPQAAPPGFERGNPARRELIEAGKGGEQRSAGLPGPS
jgi:hypothetical protein